MVEVDCELVDVLVSVYVVMWESVCWLDVIVVEFDCVVLD